MKKVRLGELEELVILALLRLGGESYAAPVAEELVRVTGREVSPAATYMVMRRLEQNGLLASRQGDPLPERGGRPRRYYSAIRAEVVPMLAESKSARLALWEGLEALLDR